MNKKTLSRKLSFDVSARTARLIGRENIGTSQAALIELIKNSYDADSTEVKLSFEQGNGIILSDSGCGMDLKVIQNHWMRIGTDNKEVSPVTPKGRVKSGAKGIGRFALDKLGDKVTMITRKIGMTRAYQWTVDWSLFDKPGASVGDIKAELMEVDVSVFESAQRAAGLLNYESGTYFHISATREEWGETQLDELYSTLESLVPYLENDEFAIEVKSEKWPDKYGDVAPQMATDYDYQIESSYSASSQQVALKIYRNELDVSQLEGKFKGVFSQPSMQKAEYQLDGFQCDYIEKQFHISELIGKGIDQEILEKIGDFHFNFIFAKNTLSREDAKKNPFRFIDYGARQEWLKQFTGVRIYRDNFRVRPYGESGDDWLRLGERQARSPQGAGQRLGAYRIRPNQISGAVMISRIDSLGLQDKSSREGIQEDASFRMLKSILLAIVNQFEIDRNIVQYSIAQEFRRINEAAATAEDGEKALENVAKGYTGEDGTHTQNAQALAAYASGLKSDKEELVEEVKILRSLASAGIVTASAGHELWSYRNRLDNRVDVLKVVLERYIHEDDFVNIDRAYNPFAHLENIKKTDNYLAGWLSYALRPIRKDRRSAKTVYIDEYLNSLNDTWERLLSAKRATLVIGKIPKNVAIKIYPIDLDSIFNNLIVNSLDSFMSSREALDRTIKIETTVAKSYLTIDYSDSGDGLSPEFKDDPERIFLPHATSKRDPKTGESIGTGMGMYIIKTIIDEYRGEISIDPSRHEKGFHLTIKLRAAK